MRAVAVQDPKPILNLFFYQSTIYHPFQSHGPVPKSSKFQNEWVAKKKLQSKDMSRGFGERFFSEGCRSLQQPRAILRRRDSNIFIDSTHFIEMDHGSL